MKKILSYADTFIGAIIRATIIFYITRFLFKDYENFNNAAPAMFLIVFIVYCIYDRVVRDKAIEKI